MKNKEWEKNVLCWWKGLQNNSHKGPLSMDNEPCDNEFELEASASTHFHFKNVEMAAFLTSVITGG